MIFADRLKVLRAAAALSQPQLAKQTGLHVGTIRQFEQGRREPTYGTLVKLAAGLGVSLSAFDVQADVEPEPSASRASTKRKPRPK